MENSLVRIIIIIISVYSNTCTYEIIIIIIICIHYTVYTGRYTMVVSARRGYTAESSRQTIHTHEITLYVRTHDIVLIDSL